MKRVLALVLASALNGACALFDDPAPDRARLVIDGEAGKEVRIIISTKFVATVNEVGQTRVVIFESDTIVARLPYETVHTIGGDQRFFAETARLDADLTSVRVQIYLDNRKEFDQGGPLLSDQPYRFVYSFNQAITQDVVVL